MALRGIWPSFALPHGCSPDYPPGALGSTCALPPGQLPDRFCSSLTLTLNLDSFVSCEFLVNFPVFLFYFGIHFFHAERIFPHVPHIPSVLPSCDCLLRHDPHLVPVNLPFLVNLSLHFLYLLHLLAVSQFIC